MDTESLQIHLNSKSATMSNGLSDCYFYINTIEVPTDYQINISVVSGAIPYSFYCVNSLNNTLNYKVGLIISTISFTQGNYNINQWLSYLQSLNLPFTITLNKLINKFTFTSSSSFTLYKSSTCFELLGLSSQDYVSDTSNIIVSNACINLQSIQVLYINSNFISKSVNVTSINKATTICTIPISTPPYSLITYANTNNYKVNIFQNSFNLINIKICDQNNNVIDLNNCHWSLTLQIDVIKFTE